MSSYVYVNSQTSLYSLPHDNLENTTGAPLELSATGADSYMMPNRNISQPGFTEKEYSDDVYAKASLQTGELKTKASFGFGSNLGFSGAPIQEGANNGGASATAGFGDSFSTYSSNNTPYIWTNGSTASFNFAVSGNTSIPSGLTVPNNLSTNTNNVIYTSLNFYALKQGGTELSNQIESLRQTYADALANKAQIDALQAQLDTYIIADKTWVLGDYLLSPNNSWEKVTMDSNGLANISYTFTPNSDFEWKLQLESIVLLDAILENTQVTLDFSHTIRTSYTAPEGTTTISRSGLFPTSAPITTPIPAAAWLFSSAMLGLIGLRRKISA